MSIEAKINLLNSIKTKMSDVITVSEMEKITEILYEEMNHYDVQALERCTYNEDDFLKTYIDSLTIEGRSPKTIKRYKYIISKFMRDVNTNTSEINVFTIRSYLGKEKERGISDRTIEGIRQIFSGYFGWLHREGLIKSNPVANIGSIKYLKKVMEIYSDADYELMKAACTNVRNKAIITFLMSTGCRISEVTQLNINNVNLTSLECKVSGKGKKERIVYLDQVSAMFLKQYLDERKDNEEALFLDLYHDNRINPGGIRSMLKTIEKRSGVLHVHPHKFRRTLATNLIRRGMPIEKVAVILGHDKIDTTMKYVVLDKFEIKQAYNRCS